MLPSHSENKGTLHWVFVCEVPMTVVFSTPNPPKKHLNLKGVEINLGAHTRGMPWDNGDAGSVPKPVFAPTGELPLPKKGNSGLDAPHTSDTS